MTKFGEKIMLAVLGAVVLIGIAVFAFNHVSNPTTQPTVDQSEKEIASLRSFVIAANEAYGIESGAVFNYSLATYGNPSNFSIWHCRDEVRCGVINPISVAKFQQPNHPSPDYAEVETKTQMVVSLHRAVPEFAGGEYPTDDVERIARAFLDQVYPDFKTIEPTLTPDQSMKGTRLNNGNYFFRWNDIAYKNTLPEGVQVELDPFIQVGITASGFIFSYDNTVAFSRQQSF